MHDQTASTRTAALLTLFDYQTNFFPKVIDGISKADMLNRLGTQANHPAWLAGSLVHLRFWMTSETGHGQKQTSEELFKKNKGI